jgi:alkanesulfonate monooxygenase SsuD/methylene tetrahydromethanopterin reductase-like flavin-dependent oxidoreductase (luciferase family)
MLAESARIVRTLLRSPPGARLTFGGRFYQLDDAPFAPEALQPGGIPLMIAAQGRRMLRVVAESADIWNLNQSPATLRDLTPLLERHCAELGRDPAEIRRSIFTYHGLLDDDPFASIDNFRRSVQAYADGGAQEIYFRMPPPERYDVLSEVSEHLAALRELGPSG